METQDSIINTLYDNFLDSIDMVLTELWVVKSEHAVASEKKKVLLSNIKTILQLGQKIQGQLAY